ncbi:MAG: hypothetical protein FJ388_10670 [Verrucomicrobia bacterium]|nr:hypothetical protein [Verrucomicrobiota bacterium]
MNDNAIVLATMKRDATEYLLLRLKMENQEQPDSRDVKRFRELVAANPKFLALLTPISEGMRGALVHKMTDGNTRAQMLAELDALKKELGYDAAHALERLLIDHILTTRVRLFQAEHTYNQKIIDGRYVTEEGIWWEHHLTAAQKRHLKAIEALAKFRRLAKNDPLVQINQINIARDGGQQVNVGSDVKVQPISEPTGGEGEKQGTNPQAPDAGAVTL